MKDILYESIDQAEKMLKNGNLTDTEKELVSETIKILNKHLDHARKETLKEIKNLQANNSGKYFLQWKKKF